MEPLSTKPYKRKWSVHWGKDAPFFACTTGTRGACCRQVRHYWFGIRGVENLRLTVSWG